MVGTIYAISVGKRGVELSLIPEGKKSDAAPPTWGNFTCRLDPSSTYLNLMLEVAQTAMRNGLLVYASGSGDDRDEHLTIHELRIFNNEVDATT